MSTVNPRVKTRQIDRHKLEDPVDTSPTWVVGSKNWGEDEHQTFIIESKLVTNFSNDDASKTAVICPLEFGDSVFLVRADGAPKSCDSLAGGTCACL